MPARILVIEDNQTNLDLMIYLLEAFGHTTLVARDGDEGLQAARRELPDVIICDLQMPRMDGYEVARWLKSHPTLRSIPLVAVTALAMVGDREKALQAGFDGYIAKPIDPQLFLGQIERMLAHGHRSSARDEGGVQAPPPSAPPSRATLLVVDNRPVNIELAVSTFEPFGYEVLTATGMGEAMALIRDRTPDLILSDVNMSGGTGYAFVSALKTNPRLRNIPIVLISSTFLDLREQEHGLALGAARYLIRPIEPQILIATVEACLLEQA